MLKLYSEKLLTIISDDSMEARLAGMFKKYGVHGYTITRVGGEGPSGLQSDMTGFSSNILAKVIVPEEQLLVLMESIERKLRKGYHLTVYVTDVQVITPEKYKKSIGQL